MQHVGGIENHDVNSLAAPIPVASDFHLLAESLPQIVWLQDREGAIEFVNRLIEQGRVPHGTGPNEYRRIRVHRIVLEGLGERISSSSKLRNDIESFELLRKLGHRAARRFLDGHFADIGVRSSIDLKAEVAAERGRGLA